MKSLLKLSVAAAALAGAAVFASAPASAGFSISIGVPGIAFTTGSGGYCDRWGCPDGYWDYPVFYGPVYYDGDWYQGPDLLSQSRWRILVLDPWRLAPR